MSAHTDIVDVISSAAELDTAVVYRVDLEARLTFVNDAWDTFAIANATPELVGPSMIGRRVTDFIAGPATKDIYTLLIKRAAAGIEISLPYRCDAPAERRRMMLTITTHLPRVIEFSSRLLAVEPRESVRVLERDPRRAAGSFLTICSWCNRGRVSDQWAEIEEVVTTLRLFDDELPQVTHGMCPDCVALVMADWRDEGAPVRQGRP